MNVREQLHRLRFRYWPRLRERGERHYWMPDPWSRVEIKERRCVLCKGAQLDQLHYWPEARGFA